MVLLGDKDSEKKLFPVHLRVPLVLDCDVGFFFATLPARLISADPLAGST